MKTLLRRFAKFFAYAAAGVVILLAIAVGLFRLFLPRLPEYQEEIKAWASSAVGMEVNFSGMDARWGLSGPELEFYNTKLSQFGREAGAIAAEEVRISVGLMNLLVNRTLVVDRIVIRDTSIEVEELDDGGDVGALLASDHLRQLGGPFVGGDRGREAEQDRDRDASRCDRNSERPESLGPFLAAEQRHRDGRESQRRAVGDEAVLAECLDDGGLQDDEPDRR